MEGKINTKILAGCTIAFFMICVASAAHGTIMYLDESESIVFDNVNNQYWISDLSILDNMTYEQQISSINNLSHLGLDWRMANGEELNALWLTKHNQDEFFLYYFQPNYGLHGYSGRFDSPVGPGYPHQLDFETISNVFIENDPAHALGLFGWDGYTDFVGGDSGTGNFFAFDDLTSDKLGAWVTASVPQPTPEPGTLVIFGTGIIGLVALRKKKKALAG